MSEFISSGDTDFAGGYPSESLNGRPAEEFPTSAAGFQQLADQQCAEGRLDGRNPLSEARLASL